MIGRMARARHGGYLFQRPESNNWWVRLRSPAKAIVRSLGTPDRRQAEILSLPLIAAHKAALLAARPQLVLRPYTLPPGREYATENGERVVATEHDLIYFDTDGKLLRTEPNSPSQELVNRPAGTVVAFGAPLADEHGPVIDIAKLERPKAPVKNGDDGLLETYLAHRNITGYYEREARATWMLFKSLCRAPGSSSGENR